MKVPFTNVTVTASVLHVDEELRKPSPELVRRRAEQQRKFKEDSAQAIAYSIMHGEEESAKVPVYNDTPIFEVLAVVFLTAVFFIGVACMCFLGLS